jgi:hypothetical protein
MNILLLVKKKNYYFLLLSQIFNVNKLSQNIFSMFDLKPVHFDFLYIQNIGKSIYTIPTYGIHN